MFEGAFFYMECLAVCGGSLSKTFLRGLRLTSRAFPSRKYEGFYVRSVPASSSQNL